MDVSPDVSAMLEALLSGVRRALNDNLVGVYLRGSLALGDFIPATSDIDAFVVTERRVNAAEFAALEAMHADLAMMPNPYANDMEIAYLDRAALKRFVPGQRHPTLYRGEALARHEHRDNWILERWIGAEHGVTLLGPDPRSLIDPIAPEDIRAAVRSRLPDWVDWADQPDDPDWRLPLAHNAYVVETMCRALYTLAHSELSTKPRAVAWALANLPEPWRALVARSQVWRTDQTIDLSVVPEVQRFIRWAAQEGEGAMATVGTRR